MAKDEEKNEISVEDPKEKKNRKIEKLNSEITKLKEEIEKLKADVEHWKNEYYRAYADTQNLRKSLEKDHRSVLKYRAEGFIENLLPILDSFHVVLSQEVEDPSLKNYLVGFQFIYRNLVSVLENEGVNEIAPKVGDKFDVNLMNAVEVEESDGEEGLITKVMTNGYRLHDRLVRPANVVVSAHPHVEEEPVEANPVEEEPQPEEEKNDKKYDA